MKKDKESLKEAVGELNLVVTEFEADGMCYMDRAVSVTQVYDLIDQLDEPEKVEPLVVPKDLVDFLVCRPLGEEAFLITMIQDLREFWSETIEGQDLYNFIADNKKQLIEVILGNRSYEVEKEKLYVVELINNNLMSCLAYDLVDKVFFISQNQEERLNKFKKRFTEKEIKDYDPRFMAFAEEVAE